MSKIPTNWKVEKFGELAKVFSGFAFKSADFLDTANGIPIIRMSDLKQGRVKIENAQRVVHSEDYNGYLLKEGDFLFGMSGSLSNYGVVNKENLPCLLNQRVGKIIPKNENHDKFINYLFISPSFQKQILDSAAGAAQLNISSKQLEEFEVIVPENKNEQKKIAEILTSVDRVIELTSIEIDKLKDLQRALEVKLFSELNEEVVNLLGEFSRIGVGIVSGSTDAYTEKGIPFLRSQNIKPNRIDEGNIIFISEEFNTKNKKSILEEGDVVIVRSGVNSGMAAVVNRKHEGANCFSLVIVKVNKTKCYPNYLSYFINSKIGQSYIQKFNFGSAQANFNVSEAIKMPIPIPALGDQARIVNILDIITENIQTKINLFEQYSNLKKGLMNDLLTAKVRVKV